jgi:hypothetical protein
VTRKEFGCIIAYLAAASGKSPTQEQAEVYFDLLGDLPAEALQFAAKRALLESCYPVLPPVGTLRKLAVDAMNGADREPTPDEAWELVRRAIGRFGYRREQAALDALPEGAVRRAAECLGWQSLCDSTEPEICRAQYRKAYESLQSRRERQRLLPGGMIEMLERIGTLPKLPELQGYDHRNAWQVKHDSAAQRRLVAPQPSERRKSA